MSEIDLHTHSTASDGTFSPAELIREAQDSGLKAVALTDHDTTKGLQEIIRAGKNADVEAIPGCELSVNYPTGQMHIVGLWLPEHPEHVQSQLQYLRDRRHSRNERILQKLQAIGIQMDYSEVKELAGDASIGRPHIARLLMEKNYVPTVQEAFDKYIGPGGQAYVPKDKLDPEQAIEVLKQEGATVILAHPYSLEISYQELRSEVQRLQGLGLDGMEVYYTEHTREQTREYLQICRELGLLASGGSDFHGSVKPDVKLGSGKGNLDIPYSLLQEMKEYRKRSGLWT
ncbi:MAG: PHP domain-containing protein [Thermodesulfobacteriota bacterium]